MCFKQLANMYYGNTGKTVWPRGFGTSIQCAYQSVIVIPNPLLTLWRVSVDGNAFYQKTKANPIPLMQKPVSVVFPSLC